MSDFNTPQAKRRRTQDNVDQVTPSRAESLLSAFGARRTPMSASRMMRESHVVPSTTESFHAMSGVTKADSTVPIVITPNFRADPITLDLETNNGDQSFSEDHLESDDVIHAVPRGTTSTQQNQASVDSRPSRINVSVKPSGSSRQQNASVEARQTPAVTRQLPQRSTRGNVSYALRNFKTESRRTRPILRRDQLLLTDQESSQTGLASSKIVTARARTRQDIAERTKPLRNAFFASHSEYFLPLLPQNNYIAKLQRNNGAGSPIVEQAILSVQPRDVKAVMKSYQLEGLTFLIKMYKNGMSAILGDEMGLGKTLQTLSLFQWIMENERSDGEVRPFLVVCPLSVLSSWISEAKKWVPALNTLRFHGPKTERERLKSDIQRISSLDQKPASRRSARSTTLSNAQLEGDDAPLPDLVVTTYETFVAEHTWFKRAFVWRYVVLDEGHKVNNDKTNIAHALQSMSAEYRLLLTGTPIQNDLKEMWALLHWLFPEVFTEDSAVLFKKSFNLRAGTVSTDFMDCARHLLEIVMLRRMKNSPGVNLDLPPREEVLLFVPLTPVQRFWYTRLLIRIDQATLEEVFKGARGKEIAVARDDKEIEALHKQASDIANDAMTIDQEQIWGESKSILQQAIENEKANKGNKTWMKLMNLIMQLRKACSHPYLIPGACPEPYVLGGHVRESSGKFIVLDKLINELVLKEKKKILIFSGFTRTLDLCEDLLVLNGANGMDSKTTTFRYSRLDGSTQRAKRNLAIRMFNDAANEFQVMLISTRAGGLGINLTAASNVVFMDEDWNPQVTLQAEARAHRIGQTKKVTIYKLCTVGTVEEQMMGRIRKKLYLSAKITESMRNLHTAEHHGKKRKRGATECLPQDDGPQLGTSQLMTLLRRGAQTLSAPEIDAAEMMGWDWKTTLEKCRDRPLDPYVDDATKTDNHLDEKAWLSQIERVETAVFEGKKHHREITKAVKKGVELSRADRRLGKNTTVMVDGFAVNKESMLCDDWEAVPTLAGKDPRLAEPVKVKKPPIENQKHCQVCWEGGKIQCCSGCPRGFHHECLDGAFQARAKGSLFHCPQHQCFDCEKKTSECGGLIYRCRWCAKGYCEDCLDWDVTKLLGQTLPEYEMLNHESPTAWYVECHTCVAGWRKDPVDEARCVSEKKAIDKEYAEYLRIVDGPTPDITEASDTPDTPSEAYTPTDWSQHEVSKMGGGQLGFPFG